MRRIIFLIVVAIVSAFAMWGPSWGQVTETFSTYITGLPAATAVGPTDQFYILQAGVSKQVPASVVGSIVTVVPAGLNGQVQYNNAGALGGLTNVQLTALINPATTSFPGLAPALSGNSGQFLNGVGAYSTPSSSGNVSTSGTITTGNCAQWNSGTTLISTSAPCGSGGGGGSGAFSDYVSIKTYGAIGDGTCHALSTIYGSLAAAQAVYPFVSDLTQCVDWAATQQAINQSFNTAPAGRFGVGGYTVSCSVGNYQLSNPVIVDTPSNGTAGTASAWVNGTTYANGATVKYNGLPFVSVGSGNVGNQPTLYNGFPAQMQIVGGGDYAAGNPWSAVQISNASPAVITPLLAGGSIAVVANQPVVFFTQQFANPNGGSAPALPTGINANQVYYVVGSSITGTTFEVSATPGGSAVATSGAGVGNFFVSGQVWQFAPIQVGNNFTQHITFVGEDTLSSDAGCSYQTQANLTSPAFVIGPGNGNLVKGITVFGQLSGPGGNASRCSAPASLGGPASPTSIVGVGSVGFAVMSNNGGASRTTFENVGIGGFYYNDYRSYGTAGGLVDQNTWIKPYYQTACVNIYMGSTQSFINTIYDGTIENGTTNVFASSQEGVKVVGGITTTNSNLSSSFTISSVSTASGCGFLCVTATIASPDTNLQQPMCAYSAGQAFNAGAQWLNAWPWSAGCGYNTFIIKTAQWGYIGMYVMNYDPFTGVITLGIPAAWAGIYQGACCGSNLATEIAAATTLFAVEAATMWAGNNQVDNVHVENDGVAYTLGCFCTKYFGGSKPAVLNNIFLNTEASLGNALCCNVVPSYAGNSYSTNALAQQVIPFINSTVGDTIIENINGGNNNQTTHQAMDRATIAVTTSGYLEARHSAGANYTQTVTSGSIQNPSSPLYDFQPTGVTTPPLVSPGTLGQLSSGYYAFGGGAYGGGVWDNGTLFGPYSQYSLNSSNQPTDIANLWRAKGLGQSPQWGVRPAPWASPCILPSQATTLGSLPAITFVSNLHDFVLPISGGTGYAMFDTITLAGGTFTTPAVVYVSGVSGGVITAVTVQSGGAYTAEPATTFTQASTSGSGTGATFTATGEIWYVNYNIGYPMLWGGQNYKACSYGSASFTGPTYNIVSSNTGYSYFQNLTTTNVPHLSWNMDGTSPFINMNYEALELMFPGLVISLTPTGGGGTCTSNTYVGIVIEVKPSLGYVKTVGASADGSAYVPALATSGTVCTGTTIVQQTPNTTLH
jgi:hypothetical protein